MLLNVKEMSCNHCVARIHQALEAAGIKHEINLEKKQVEIFGDDTVLNKAIAELDDIGFTGEK